MTASDLSSALEKHGVSLSPAGVRKAWTRGAPSSSVAAFLDWLADSENITNNSIAASRVVHEKGPAEIDDPVAGLAVLVELLQPVVLDGIAFRAALYETLASLLASGGGDFKEIVGAGFTEHAVAAADAIAKLAAVAPDISRRLEERGVATPDVRAWRRASAFPAVFARGDKAKARFIALIPSK